MRLDFSIYEFLQRMLPDHKRKPNRIKLFWWTLRSLLTVQNLFKLWQKDALFRINITGQLKCLEFYLNRYVAGANNSIAIIESEHAEMWCSLEAEQSDVFWTSVESEGDFVEMVIEGEEGDKFPVNFRVVAPATADQPKIIEIVDSFKLAGKTYDIR